MQTYGFLGAGAITAAIVEGLGVADPPAVFLSPRGREVGQELVARFSNVQVCESNQDVLDNATSIVVAVRPQLVRFIPLPSAARAQSLTAMYPDNAVARELFSRVGGVLVPGEEKTLEAFSAATATFAAHLDYLATIADWLAEQDVDRAAANAALYRVLERLRK